MTETFEIPRKAALVLTRFHAEFGGSGARLFFAPGRVNLVGNHVDYNGGTVLPLALDKGVFVAARLNTAGLVRLRSLDCEPSLDLELAGIDGERDAAHGWASYPLGVCQYFAAETNCSSGIEMVFGGDLPMASGLSSSAAVEVATGVALDALHGTALPLADLARIGFEAETRYIGLQCGIMDQFASALGRLGQVLILQCATQSFEYAPLDPDMVEFLVMNTGVPRNLAESNYNHRVEECAQAHSILNRVHERAHLADFTAEDLLAAGGALTGDPRRRATHVVMEMQRVRSAVDALRAGDLEVLGGLLDASHASSRDLYDVSCPELDLITEAARECDEVLGARLMGAGFGGCAVALLRPGAGEGVRAHIHARFERDFAVAPSFELMRAGAGPRELRNA